MTPTRLNFLLVAAVLFAGSHVPVAAAWPGANGPIVFEAFVPGGEERDRGSGIWIAPLGGGRSQTTRLTTDRGDTEPQAAPNGRQIVFTRRSDPEALAGTPPATIYLIGADGSGLRPLTDGQHADGEPTFSPSGSTVYFTRRVPGHGTDIFSVGVAGGTARPVVAAGATDRHPRLSARRGLLTFVRGSVGSSEHVYIARADGSRVQDLTPRLGTRLQASDPEFSPDGKRIAYSTGDRLLSVRIDGRRPRLLLRRRAGDDLTYADPTYAPDGRSLLYTMIDGGRSNLMRLDLRRLRRLPQPLMQPHTGARNPAWLASP